MIRAFCLLDSSNKRIFHWAGNVAGSAEWFGKLERELSAGQLPKIVKDFVRAASLGNEKSRLVELEEHPLTLCIHRGFLIVADVDSEDNYSKTMPQLLAEIDRAVGENLLSFNGLLSDIDMPGRSRLVSQITAILELQGTEGDSAHGS